MTKNEKTEEKVVHLMTQRDQPYGSTRRCCELCGVMIWGNSLTENHHGHRWTSDEGTFNNAHEQGYRKCTE